MPFKIVWSLADSILLILSWSQINPSLFKKKKLWGFPCILFSSAHSLSHVWLCNTMDCSTPGFLVHHQLPEFAQTHVQSSRWRHPTFSSSVVPFSSCLQSLPASGSFKNLNPEINLRLLLPCLGWESECQETMLLRKRWFKRIHALQ